MASGLPAPTITLTGGTLPNHVNFSSGTLAGIPAAGTAGSYPLTFTATNGVSPEATQSFTLVINTPPVAGADTMGTRQGQSASVPVGRLLLNDRDADGDPLSIAAVSPTSAQGGTLQLSTGVVTYSPAPSFSGNDSFSYTLSDGRGGLASGTVSVTVTASSAGTQNIASVTLVGGVPHVTAFGIVGLTYRLQFTDDMGSNWTTLDTQTTAADGALRFSDPTVPLPPQRFYRVLEVAK